MHLKIQSVFLAFVIFVVPLLFGIQEVPYGTGSWDEELYGNHRVVIQINDNADAVWVHVPWRRRDKDPEQKSAILIDAQTGKQVLNLCRVSINREFGDFVLQPTSGPGKYYLYYLPNQMSGRSNYPTVTYPEPAQTADQQWLQSHDLTQDVLSTLNPGDFPRQMCWKFRRSTHSTASTRWKSLPKIRK